MSPGPKLPSVYRYLPQEYIDTFFATGVLQLSCFTTFADLQDRRRDTREGFATLAMLTPPSPVCPNGESVFAVLGLGRDMYILSTSLLATPDLASRFNATGCFRVTDPVQFGEAIARSIPGCLGWAYGTCKYQERSITRENAPPIDRIALSKEPDGLTKLMRHLQSGAKLDPLFLKPPDKYQDECEFRFVWKAPRQVTKSECFDCSAALEFCEPVSPKTTEGKIRVVPWVSRFRQIISYPMAVKPSRNDNLMHTEPTPVQDVADATAVNKTDLASSQPVETIMMPLTFPRGASVAGFASDCFVERQGFFIEFAFYSPGPSCQCIARIVVGIDDFSVQIWPQIESFYRDVAPAFPREKSEWPVLLETRPSVGPVPVPIQGTHFNIARTGFSACLDVSYLPPQSVIQLSEGADPTSVRVDAIVSVQMPVLLLLTMLQWAEQRVSDMLEEAKSKGAFG